MRYQSFFSLPGALLLGVMQVFGQETAAADAPVPSASKAFHWSAEFDGYSSGNLNDLGSGTNALRSFDARSNTFRVNMIDLGLDYSTAHWEAHMDTGYGDEFRAMAGTDRFKGPNSYIPQLYVSYKPIRDSALQIDFGKFYTSVGAEVPDASVDFNYSRSLLFTLGEPLYHFGLRVNVPLTKTFTAGVQVINGWNGVEDNNRAKTLGFTTALVKSKWSWSQTIMLGPEKNGTTAGQRVLANEVVTVTLRPSLQSYVELLYGRDKRVGPGTDAWYGVAGASRWTATKKLSLAMRLEYYVDRAGFTTGTVQQIREATATAEYRLYSFFAARLEYREDFSNRRVFGHDPNNLGKQQGTVLLALLFSLKGER